MKGLLQLYLLNDKHIYVTWPKSTIHSKKEFHEKLLALLPSGIRLFGCRELHENGTPHYHVVFFPAKVHWPDARGHFSIEGDTNAIQFKKPKLRQRTRDFLENTMAYCAKDENIIGECLSSEGAVAEQKKRKWQNIVDEKSKQKA